MRAAILTPELTAYCTQIAIQRGITEFTRESLGDVLKLALVQMDRAACAYLDKSHVRNAVEKSVYDGIIMTTKGKA